MSAGEILSAPRASRRLASPHFALSSPPLLKVSLRAMNTRLVSDLRGSSGFFNSADDFERIIVLNYKMLYVYANEKKKRKRGISQYPTGKTEKATGPASDVRRIP